MTAERQLRLATKFSIQFNRWDGGVREGPHILDLQDKCIQAGIPKFVIYDIRIRQKQKQLALDNPMLRIYYKYSAIASKAISNQ